MSPFLKVVALALAMGLTSYAAAIMPLKVSIPHQKMGFLSAFSMGILVGTVLCLVIPEGAEAVVEAVRDIEDYDVLRCMGMSLLAGFMLMFVIDNSSSSTPEYFQLSSWEGTSKIRSQWLSIARSTLTLGLLLHSFVDGIALGTSYLDDTGSFELLFFFVIIIHKLPTAMSLSVVLLQEGVLPDMCMFHALIFALTTPVASILTYLIAQLFGLNSQFIVGILLLFSAGTFLYSVMHVTMEIVEKKQAHVEAETCVGTEIAEAETEAPQSLTRVELALVILGMVVPVLFAQLSES